MLVSMTQRLVVNTTGREGGAIREGSVWLAFPWFSQLMLEGLGSSAFPRWRHGRERYSFGQSNAGTVI